MTPARHLKVFPPALLWSLFCGCVALALFLIPRDDELLHRLLADGQQERAIELAVAAGASSETERLVLQIAEEAAAPAAEPAIDSSELIAYTMSGFPAGPLGSEQIDRISAAIERAPGTADEFAHISARAGDMRPGDVESLYGTFARKALGRSDPAFAAEVYTKLRRLVPRPSAATVDSMVMTYRFAGQPIMALDVLEGQHDLAGPISGLPEALRETLVALYLESSQPGRAFALLRSEIAATKDQALLAKLIPQAIQAANFSGNDDDLTPLLQRLLDSMPESAMTLAELVEAGRADPAADRPFVRYAKQCAQHCEWTDRYDIAFDLYCKAAALGDQPSLERCIALHDGLFRHDDLGKLMHQMAPFEGDARPRLTRLLASLLGRAGRYEEAEVQYQKYLAMVPGDVDALESLAALRAEVGNLEGALETYGLARRERPGHIDLVIRTAELHIALDQHREAFELFRDIPEEMHTDTTLEHFLLLANALGDVDELNRAQRIAFSRKTEHVAEDYLDLAESYVLMGDLENEIMVLRGAVQVKPDSTKLALALADSLYRDNKFEEAADLLTRADLKDNVRALALFIEICGGNDRFVYAASHLPSGVEHRHHFSPSIRIELGQIYEETGDIAAAEALYASVPEGREAWQLLASAKYRQGDLDRAEEYQLKYLRAAIEPDAEDWMFMGDIYKSQGKIRLADEAYRHSLNMLKAGL